MTGEQGRHEKELRVTFSADEASFKIKHDEDPIVPLCVYESICGDSVEELDKNVTTLDADGALNISVKFTCVVCLGLAVHSVIEALVILFQNLFCTLL